MITTSRLVGIRQLSLEPVMALGERGAGIRPLASDIDDENGSNEGEMVKNLDIGDSAPDFAWTSDDARSVSLKSLQGKAVVVYFYPKDDTTACTAEAIAFNALRQEFDALGAAIVGV